IAVNNSLVGISPASESWLAFTIIMNRIVLSPLDLCDSLPGRRSGSPGRQDAGQFCLCRPDSVDPARCMHHSLPPQSGRYLPILLQQAIRRCATVQLRPRRIGAVLSRLPELDGSLAPDATRRILYLSGLRSG